MCKVFAMLFGQKMCFLKLDFSNEAVSHPPAVGYVTNVHTAGAMCMSVWALVYVYADVLGCIKSPWPGASAC